MKDIFTMKTETLCKLSLLLLVVAALFLSGCGSKLACNNAKGGVRCETITSVYESIQAGEKIDDKKPWNFYYEKSDRGGSPSGGDKRSKKAVKSYSDDPASDVVRNLDINDKKPLRLPTKIIGIWIAPWVDTQGDLRKPEMIYSEIQDKRGRWLFGEEEVSYSDYVTNPVRRVLEERDSKDKQEKPKEVKEQPKGVKK